MSGLEPQGTRGLVEVALVVFFLSVAAVTIGVLVAPFFIR